jgi:hypothetical protein
MSKKKVSRIAKLEQKVLEMTYFIGAMKTRSELFEKTVSEYIEYKKDWDDFNKYVDKKKKTLEKKDK